MDLIKKEDLQQISLPELENSLKEVLSVYQKDINSALFNSKKSRTKLEIYIGSINDFNCPTVDSKYWQVLLELNAVINSVMTTYFELRKKKLLKEKEFKKLEENLNLDEIDKELIKLEIEKLEFEEIQLISNLNQTLNELKMLIELKKEIEPEVIFSKDNFSEYQIDYLTKKLINEFFIATSQNNTSAINSIYPLLYSCFKIMRNNGTLKEFIKGYDDKSRELLNRWFQVDA